MAGKTPMPRDPEDERNDLLATLAAARELGPDMDKALAESYLQRQQAQPKTPAPAPVPAPASVPAAPAQSSTPSMPWPLYFTPALGIIAYIALLVISKGNLWWTFWLIPALGGWGWWGGHRGYRYQRHMERQQWRRARWEARYGGYEPSQPQPSAPPEVTSPQQPSPQQPQKSPPPIEYD